MKLKILFYIVLLLLIFSSNSYGFSCDKDYFEKPSSMWIYNNTTFVTSVPASIGYYSLYPIGYISALPFASMKANSLFEIHWYSQIIAHEGLARVGYYLLGTPFFLAKKILYDIPVNFFTFLFTPVERSSEARTVILPRNPSSEKNVSDNK